MHRRSFLVRCGLAAVGTTFLPVSFPAVSCLQAATAAKTQPFPQLTDADHALLSLLSAYSSDVSFWGGQVFARATGIVPSSDTTQLRVQVADYSLLVAFLRSDAEKSLGVVHVAGNTLSFSYLGTAYVVTNQSSTAAATAVGAPPPEVTHAVRFTHETMVYHPATDTLSDPQLALNKRRIDLVATPTGGLKSQFETLLHGWVDSSRYGLKLSKRFTSFQDRLLGAEPTAKAAQKVVQSLLENITALAAAFDVDALRPLLTSPLVSASLQQALGLDGEAVLAQLAKLRAELASGDYTDAALWLAALLPTQFQDGTASQWFDLPSGDDAASAATLAAFSSARQLVQTPGFARL